MRSLSLCFTVGLLVVAIAGCETGRRGRPMDDGGLRGDGGLPPGSCVPGGAPQICVGTYQVTCNPDGSEGARVNCVDSGNVCAPGIGCTVCQPNRGSCMGNEVLRCRADGSGYDTVTTCDPAMGQACNAGAVACTSPCDDARASRSYIGCDYWPVTTLNSQLDGAAFRFAVVVSNPQTSAANVTITRNGATVASAMVAPNSVQQIELPWVDELRQSTAGMERSVISRGGAYHLTSTLPVTVYQFNPLEFQSGGAFSFTNDASLLLPAHVLTGNYVVTARESMFLEIVDGLFGSTDRLTSPGFFAVVATAPGMTSVRATFTAAVVASADGSVRAFNRGEAGTFMLNQGDVLEIVGASPPTCDRSGARDMQGFDTIYYCRTTQYDLTGTEIRASAPVAVVAGHNCDFVPYNRWACDHLEEQLFPEDTWGRDYVVSVTQPLRGEPNVVRIMSGTDGNMLTFDPPSISGPMTLNRGQFFELEVMQSFRVQGTAALQIGQFLVGQDYAGIGSTGMGGQGDPAMSLAIPTDQYRSSYAFLAPMSYAQSYVNITAPTGTTITLDGAPVSAPFMPVGASGHGVARVPISGGAHRIEGSMPFGIVVYGFGQYTSYMYPGGLDLEAINPLI